MPVSKTRLEFIIAMQKLIHTVSVVHAAPNKMLNSDARQLRCLVPSAFCAPARVSLGR